MNEDAEVAVPPVERYIEARARANAAALPGPLKDTLAGKPLTYGKLTLRPLELGDVVLLERLGSPMFGESGEAASDKLTFAALCDVIFLLGTDYESAEAMVEHNEKEFHRSAKQFVKSLRLPLSAMGEIALLIGENVRRSMSTQVAHTTSEGSSPLTPAPTGGQTTALAGGLTSTGA